MGEETKLKVDFIKRIDMRIYQELQDERIVTLRKVLRMKSERHGSKDMTEEAYNAYREFDEQYRVQIAEVALLERRIAYTKLIQERDNIQSIQRQINQNNEIVNQPVSQKDDSDKETQAQKQKAQANKAKSLQRKDDIVSKKIDKTVNQIGDLFVQIPRRQDGVTIDFGEDIKDADKTEIQLEDLPKRELGDQDGFKVEPVDDIKSAERELKAELKELYRSKAIFKLWKAQINDQFVKFETLHGLIEVLNELASELNIEGLDIKYNPESNNYSINDSKLKSILQTYPSLDPDVASTIISVLRGYQNYSLGYSYDSEDPSTIEKNEMFGMGKKSLIRQYLTDLERNIQKPDYWRTKAYSGFKYEYKEVTPNKKFERVSIWAIKALGILENNGLHLFNNIKRLIQRRPRLPETKEAEELRMTELILNELTEPGIISQEHTYDAHSEPMSLIAKLDKKYSDEPKPEKRRELIKNDLRPYIRDWVENIGSSIERDGEQETDENFAERVVIYKIIPSIRYMNLEDLPKCNTAKTQRSKMLAELVKGIGNIKLPTLNRQINLEQRLLTALTDQATLDSERILSDSLGSKYVELWDEMSENLSDKDKKQIMQDVLRPIVIDCVHKECGEVIKTKMNGEFTSIDDPDFIQMLKKSYLLPKIRRLTPDEMKSLKEAITKRAKQVEAQR